VDDESGDERKTLYTFKAPAWWIALVQTKLAHRGAKRAALAAIHERFKVRLDEGSFSRAARGKRVQIDVALWLSDVLGIPPPLFIPQTEGLARAFVAEASLQQGVSPLLAAISAEVSEEETVGAGRPIHGDDELPRPRLGPVRAPPRRRRTGQHR
jgi:hypothetical protein